MIDLRPCPFCGGDAATPEYYGESKTARFIICMKCGANVYRARPGENDVVLAAAWNRRNDLNGRLKRIGPHLRKLADALRALKRQAIVPPQQRGNDG